MPKSPKPTKVKKSLEGKSSAKKKTGKKKLSDSSKNNVDNKEIQELVIEDEMWQCSVVLLLPQTYSIRDFLLQVLVNLPENFTVLTKDAITSTSKSQKGSNKKTTDRSTSKSSKKSDKSKATKSKNKSKKEVEETEHLESSNEEVNNFKECLALKKLLIGLRNADVASIFKNIRDSKTNSPESKMKVKDMRSRGSGDEVDSKRLNSGENLINYENIFHRFVILLGFYDPFLLEELKKLNVSIKAVVNVRNFVDVNIDTHSNENLSTTVTKSKRKLSEKNKKGSDDRKVSSEFSLFLDKITALLSTAEFLEKFKDVVFLNYTIKNLSTKTKEIGLKYKSDMLEILYKIKDAWKKYNVYTKSIFVQNVPTADDILKLDDAKIYSTMISMVPLECTNIAVILHCIVEQVSWWNDVKCVSEERDNHLLDNKSTMSTRSNSLFVPLRSFGKNKTPILIHHRDEIKLNTFHLDLPEFDFEEISTNLLTKTPVFKLWERYPPHPKPVRKWFEFQLQKLQNSSDNCILKLDSMFPIYLHFLLMDVLIFKVNQFTNSNDNTIGLEPEIKNVHEMLMSGKEPEERDSNAGLFIKEIIYNILCMVPNHSLCQNYLEVFVVVPAETTQCSLKQPIYLNRLRNKPTKEFLGETLLQKRELHQKQKLNKLVSFLNCSEFVSLYEDFSKLNFCDSNKLANYGFIEILNTQTLCQCLQQASQAFSNINYDYFPVTDSILLWFNNSEQDQVLTSSTSKSVLETPLGFRDFYCHKMRESTDFGDIINVEVKSKKSFEISGDSFVDELKADLELSTDNHRSAGEGSEKHFRVEACTPTIAYNLGSLRMEATESFKNFFSVDSSSVTIKKAEYFNSKTCIAVNINKNNTSLRYELDPESSKNFVTLNVDVHETLNLNCVLKWDILPEKSFIHRSIAGLSDYFEMWNDSKYKLNCSLSITLPSGLFIEVVPSNSKLGPFYIRQRYLSKGPNCSSIWEETYRCYFNNGMVMIFRVDGSVDIIYSNGTTVKCHSIELIEPNDLLGAKDKKIDQNSEEDLKKDTNKNLNQDGTKKTKGSPSSKKKKEAKDKKKSHSEDIDQKETNKQSQKKKSKVKKELKNESENKEEKTSLLKEREENIGIKYRVAEHSVLSWDGEFSQYSTENCTDMKKCLSLRTAFDIINHELYWQRSDGMSALQAASNLTIKFPDGSKTTSFTIDNKELWVENGYAIIYLASGDLVKIEPLIIPHNTNRMSVSYNKGNRDSNQKPLFSSTDFSSIDSFSTESSDERGFVYVESSFLMEHTNYASIEFSNEECELKINLPCNCWVIVDKSGHFSFKGHKNERIHLFNDSLLFDANVLSTSTLSKSITTFRFENVGTIPTTFSQTEDSFGNVFSVDERGNTTYFPSGSGDNRSSLLSGQKRSSVTCSARFPQNTERIFVFNRDLTGYEMVHDIEQASKLSNEGVQTVNTPVIKGDSELYCSYMQSPIYRTKCEEYTMHNIDEVTPSLIKRKDLLKTHKTPETIWFYPEISSVKKVTRENEVNIEQSEESLKAMKVVNMLKVKKKGLNPVSLVSKSLTKYMEMNEQIYQKYFNCHPKETLKEEDLIECEKNRMDFLGSKSYFLTDNLPVVITGEVADGKELNKNIFNIFSASVSKMSFE